MKMRADWKSQPSREPFAPQDLYMCSSFCEVVLFFLPRRNHMLLCWIFFSMISMHTKYFDVNTQKDTVQTAQKHGCSEFLENKLRFVRKVHYFFLWKSPKHSNVGWTFYVMKLFQPFFCWNGKKNRLNPSQNEILTENIWYVFVWFKTTIYLEKNNSRKKAETSVTYSRFREICCGC